MNCFVASALGYEDVDAIYERGIRPVLKKLKVKPLRVDRVEHNEDIDDKIFELIDQSDLCIADLTYARPSVYYEAGYAFGQGKPVIYIARSDHFIPRVDDKAGNLRVHFDLQMKNIIKWKRPDDGFKNRLFNRLEYILKPLLRQKQIFREKSKVEAKFKALSQNRQLSGLIVKAKSLLRMRGYSKRVYPKKVRITGSLYT